MHVWESVEAIADCCWRLERLCIVRSWRRHLQDQDYVGGNVRQQSMRTFHRANTLAGRICGRKVTGMDVWQSGRHSSSVKRPGAEHAVVHFPALASHQPNHSFINLLVVAPRGRRHRPRSGGVGQHRPAISSVHHGAASWSWRQ